MKKTLVIVESPTKAKTINKFLGKEYRVESSFGHIRDLPKSKMGVDIENNFEPSYIVPLKAKKRATELKKLAKEVEKIYFATDEDREGESIAWHLASLFKMNPEKTKRIVFHEITKNAIQDALKNPRPIDMHLVDAQQARRILDRLVGYELSPFLWKKIRRGLSAGRVQSVALRLIVEREREINAFKPQEYWSIEGLFKTKNQKTDEQSFEATLVKINGETVKKLDIKNEKEAQVILSELEKTSYTISEIKEKDSKKTPPPPFTTSTLQQEANKKLGFSAKQTMMFAQQLYEGITLGQTGAVGLITYMRTDSVNLATKFTGEAKKFITEQIGKEYALENPRGYKTKQKLAQEAHEAIRPTEVHYAPESIKEFLDDKQFKLYEMIWKRALATQMQEAQLKSTSVDIIDNNKKYTFRATGSHIVFPGYIKIYPDTLSENFLPKMEQNEEVLPQEIKKEQHFTQPPARYSEANLVKTLEENGIGRPSTYAPTIATLVERGYIEKEERRLKPTEIGILVTDLLVEHFTNIVDYKFTANLEDELDAIAQGSKTWQPIIKNFYGPFKKNLILKEKEVNKKDLVEEKTDEVCDKCKKPMVIKMGRFGKFLACTGYPECKNTKPIDSNGKPQEAETTSEKCEKCGSPMVIKFGRFGKFLGCSKYPDCKNIKKIEKKTGVTCPQCTTGDIVEKRGKGGRNFYACNQYPKCKFALWSKPTGEKCPKCTSLIVFAKNSTVQCSNKECDYKKGTEGSNA